eukprot:758001-Hanusia_phi.AAC.1
MSMVGTPSYAAVCCLCRGEQETFDACLQPEVLKSEHYGEAADMWGLGCIMYEMMSLNFLWESKGLLAIKPFCSCCVVALLARQLRVAESQTSFLSSKPYRAC